MIIAFWGQSATAKTTVAKLLASALGQPLRMCGEEIRNAAKQAGVPIAEVSDELHRSVDDATRSWVLSHATTGAVLEGRFLDQVLHLQPNVVFVRAICEPATRLRRWIGRSGERFDGDDLAKLDKADDLFRARMYGSADMGAARYTLDTSSGEADQWADEVLSFIDGSRTAPRG